jgi:tetratricopeptide (TPR) repeat protein
LNFHFHKFNLVRLLVLPLVLMVVAGCAPNQSSFTSDIYHNVTAHYNGYFYAAENIKSVEQVILKSLDDDHNQLLRLFPKIDTTLANSYEQETEEAIKMASISIQRHPNSKWVHKNYILVGLARLYAGDFQNAIQTFKFVNTKSKEPDLRHQALIHLMRTFTEQGEFSKSEETADFLAKEKLNKLNAKNLFLEKAYMYQSQSNYDKMVQNLTLADSLLTTTDRKSRIYFIVGQVYQKLGFGAEAFDYYKKCLASNPEYEIDFYARLNMAQVARVDDQQNAKSIRKQFMQMLKDEKNLEFKDKIYYEIGEFELKLGNLSPAIDNYKASLRAGTNKRIKGNGYLRLGQIYYDSMRKYDLAKAYYDSAVTELPSDTEGLENIKKRQNILVDFVIYTGTIKLQDSLLALALLDTAILHQRLDSATKAAEKLALAKKPKKKISTDNSGGTGPGGTFYGNETTTTSDWYFGNLSAVSIGQTEFQRIWGNIRLEDNWRRSIKSSNAPSDVSTVAAITATQSTDKEVAPEKKQSLFSQLYAQLPVTPEQKLAAHVQIEESYFKLGDLYYFRLQEKKNATETYKILLKRYPESKFRPEVLYKLYLAAKEESAPESALYKSELIEKYPTSTFAKLAINPNYLLEATATAEKQKILYKNAYSEFLSGQLVSASRAINEAVQLGETSFVPQLELLKILITGKTEDITRYQYELTEFMRRYPDDSLKNYAGSLLEASKTFIQRSERAKGIRFVRGPEQPHQVVIAHRKEDKLSTSLTTTLERLNSKEYNNQKLVVSNLAFTDELTLTFVLDFQKLKEAEQYLKQVQSRLLESEDFINYKFNIFVITQENFGTLYRTKALDEYLAFYERNY